MNKNITIKKIIIFTICIVSIICIVFLVRNVIFDVNRKSFGSVKLVIEYDVNTTIDEMETVTFGSYPQSDITGNIKEPIEWIVLDRQEGKVLLLSKYVIDYKQYNKTRENTTWETCSLQEWLNDEFYRNSFDNEECNRIQITYLRNKAPVMHRTNGGNDTHDRIFCLSDEEISKYFFNMPWRFEFRKKIATRATEYAKSKGHYEPDLFNMWYSNNSEYWLRTPAYKSQDEVECVSRGGFLSVPYYVNQNFGVRPALWVSY